MIAEYKFYHGAVLAELVCLKAGPLAVDEANEKGRSSFYILNRNVSVQIKHSTNRLYPWQFTFSKADLAQLIALQSRYKAVFVVLVCYRDGMLTLRLEEMTSIVAVGESDQAWVRVARSKKEWYSITGAATDRTEKRPRGVGIIIQALDANL